MKKIYFLVFLLSCQLFEKSEAQVDTSTVQKLLQYVMQPLDKSQISTGYLEEYGCPIIPMSTFNGTLTDSNRIDMNLWRSLYFQLHTGWARSTTNPLPAITTVNSTIKMNTGDTVAIPLLLGTYNTVKSNAFSSNLLSYNTGQNKVYDVANRPQSPYDTKNLFAAAPVKNQTIKGTETFVVKTNTVWNNTGKTISQLQINFDNGEGFKTITLGTPLTISYNDTGRVRWTIKATLNDASILQCYSNYYVSRIDSALGGRYTNAGVTLPAWGIIGAVGGVHSGAVVRVDYSNLSPTNTLRKPLIVVEGYDVSDILPEISEDYNIVSFINSIEFEPLGFDFNGSLDDIAGYDLVFINFNDGTDDIIRNAAVVQEVINRVNANKVNDDRFDNIRQQNVILGLSMGGLCARYALANMTKNFPGTPTETRLLLTHDSPHRGANVPLGAQYLITMVGEAELFGTDVRDIYPQYDQVVGLLAEPATEQMLMYRALTANTMAANTFLDAAYRNMITFTPSDPEPAYRFVATSNGSECAHPLFAAGTNMLNINGDGFLFYLPVLSYRIQTIAKFNALPSTGSTSEIARFKLNSKLKLFGLITISKDYYSNTANAPGTQLPIDGVPGGLNPLVGTDFEVPSLNSFIPLHGLFGLWGYVSVQTSGTPSNFTFVPLVSALDISPYNSNVFTQQFVSGFNAQYPSTSTTFIAQETAGSLTNNTHIRFTARNSRWMFNEMENIVNSEACSNECTPNTNWSLSGPEVVCTSGIYTVSGLPAGIIPTWSITGSATIAGIASNGRSATVTRVGSGTINVVATIPAIANCNPQQAVSKLVKVGPATAETLIAQYSSGVNAGILLKEVNCMEPYLPGSFQANINWYDYVGSNFSWSLVSKSAGSTANFQMGSDNQSATITLRPQNAYATYMLTASNACGSLQKNYRFNASSTDCAILIEELLQATPNPTSSRITLDLKEGQIMTIRIKDKFGNVLRAIKDVKSSSRVEVDLSQLKTDMYIVEVFDGKTWFVKKIIKQ